MDDIIHSFNLDRILQRSNRRDPGPRLFVIGSAFRKAPEDFVFPGTKGGVSAARQLLLSSLQASGEASLAATPTLPPLPRPTPHAASLLIAAGTNMKAVSEWLGHSSVAITFDVYGHLFAGHDEEIVKGLDSTYRAAEANPSEAQVVTLR